ncbi:MAG: helix-turn-helix domain-containing protein [Candidatus Gastranaerophilales bacterium]|nr:helix-turn-helix domain-containing protein [Candidatus Gastranaerophilales bacterium]
MNKKQKSLAQFVAERREKLNLSQIELAQNSGLELEQIQSIEQGYELFLSTTIRQKLAKGLKTENKEIKRHEIKIDLNLVKNDTMDEIREQILLNSTNPNFEIKCPKCGEKLITRIAKLYDLEDNLVLRPKARCSKCPFQLTD